MSDIYDPACPTDEEVSIPKSKSATVHRTIAKKKPPVQQFDLADVPLPPTPPPAEKMRTRSKTRSSESDMTPPSPQPDAAPMAKSSTKQPLPVPPPDIPTCSTSESQVSQTVLSSMSPVKPVVVSRQNPNDGVQTAISSNVIPVSLIQPTVILQDLKPPRGKSAFSMNVSSKSSNKISFQIKSTKRLQAANEQDDTLVEKPDTPEVEEDDIISPVRFKVNKKHELFIPQVEPTPLMQATMNASLFSIPMERVTTRSRKKDDEPSDCESHSVDSVPSIDPRSPERTEQAFVEEKRSPVEDSKVLADSGSKTRRRSRFSNIAEPVENSLDENGLKNKKSSRHSESSVDEEGLRHQESTVSHRTRSSVYSETKDKSDDWRRSLSPENRRRTRSKDSSDRHSRYDRESRSRNSSKLKVRRVVERSLSRERECRKKSKSNDEFDDRQRSSLDNKRERGVNRSRSPSSDREPRSRKTSRSNDLSDNKSQYHGRRYETRRSRNSDTSPRRSPIDESRACQKRGQNSIEDFKHDKKQSPNFKNSDSPETQSINIRSISHNSSAIVSFDSKKSDKENQSEQNSICLNIKISQETPGSKNSPLDNDMSQIRNRSQSPGYDNRSEKHIHSEHSEMLPTPDEGPENLHLISTDMSSIKQSYVLNEDDQQKNQCKPESDVSSNIPKPPVEQSVDNISKQMLSAKVESSRKISSPRIQIKISGILPTADVCESNQLQDPDSNMDISYDKQSQLQSLCEKDKTKLTSTSIDENQHQKHIVSYNFIEKSVPVVAFDGDPQTNPISLAKSSMEHKTESYEQKCKTVIGSDAESKTDSLCESELSTNVEESSGNVTTFLSTDSNNVVTDMQRVKKLSDELNIIDHDNNIAETSESMCQLHEPKITSNEQKSPSINSISSLQSDSVNVFKIMHAIEPGNDTPTCQSNESRLKVDIDSNVDEPSSKRNSRSPCPPDKDREISKLTSTSDTQHQSPEPKSRKRERSRSRDYRKYSAERDLTPERNSRKRDRSRSRDYRRYSPERDRERSDRQESSRTRRSYSSPSHERRSRERNNSRERYDRKRSYRSPERRRSPERDSRRRDGNRSRDYEDRRRSHSRSRDRNYSKRRHSPDRDCSHRERSKPRDRSESKRDSADRVSMDKGKHRSSEKPGLDVKTQHSNLQESVEAQNKRVEVVHKEVVSSPVDSSKPNVSSISEIQELNSVKSEDAGISKTSLADDTLVNIRELKKSRWDMVQEMQEDTGDEAMGENIYGNTASKWDSAENTSDSTSDGGIDHSIGGGIFDENISITSLFMRKEKPKQIKSEPKLLDPLVVKKHTKKIENVQTSSSQAAKMSQEHIEATRRTLLQLEVRIKQIKDARKKNIVEEKNQTPDLQQSRSIPLVPYDSNSGSSSPEAMSDEDVSVKDDILMSAVESAAEGCSLHTTGVLKSVDQLRDGAAIQAPMVVQKTGCSDTSSNRPDNRSIEGDTLNCESKAALTRDGNNEPRVGSSELQAVAVMPMDTSETTTDVANYSIGQCSVISTDVIDRECSVFDSSGKGSVNKCANDNPSVDITGKWSNTRSITYAPEQSVASELFDGLAVMHSFEVQGTQPSLKHGDQQPSNVLGVSYDDDIGISTTNEATVTVGDNTEKIFPDKAVEEELNLYYSPSDSPVEEFETTPAEASVKGADKVSSESRDAAMSLCNDTVAKDATSGTISNVVQPTSEIVHSDSDVQYAKDRKSCAGIINIQHIQVVSGVRSTTGILTSHSNATSGVECKFTGGNLTRVTSNECIDNKYGKSSAKHVHKIGVIESQQCFEQDPMAPDKMPCQTKRRKKSRWDSVDKAGVDSMTADDSNSVNTTSHWGTPDATSDRCLITPAVTENTLPANVSAYRSPSHSALCDTTIPPIVLNMPVEKDEGIAQIKLKDSQNLPTTNVEHLMEESLSENESMKTEIIETASGHDDLTEQMVSMSSNESMKSEILETGSCLDEVNDQSMNVDSHSTILDSHVNQESVAPQTRAGSPKGRGRHNRKQIDDSEEPPARRRSGRLQSMEGQKEKVVDSKKGKEEKGRKTSRATANQKDEGQDRGDTRSRNDQLGGYRSRSRSRSEERESADKDDACESRRSLRHRTRAEEKEVAKKCATKGGNRKGVGKSAVSKQENKSFAEAAEQTNKQPTSQDVNTIPLPTVTLGVDQEIVSNDVVLPSTAKPEKVKSRWRRASEAECLVHRPESVPSPVPSPLASQADAYQSKPPQFPTSGSSLDVLQPFSDTSPSHGIISRISPAKTMMVDRDIKMPIKKQTLFLEGNDSLSPIVQLPEPSLSGSERDTKMPIKKQGFIDYCQEASTMSFIKPGGIRDVTMPVKKQGLFLEDTSDNAQVHSAMKDMLSSAAFNEIDTNIPVIDTSKSESETNVAADIPSNAPTFEVSQAKVTFPLQQEGETVQNVIPDRFADVLLMPSSTDDGMLSYDVNDNESTPTDEQNEAEPREAIAAVKYPTPNQFPPFYLEIQDNVYLRERRRSKQMREVRRMVCDCTTSQEDRENGIAACGEDCLNRMLMIECGSRCPCGEYCTNRNIQQHNSLHVEAFNADSKGWGLRTNVDSEPGKFVMEYVGEVLDYREFKNRTKLYAKTMNEHYYFMSLNADEIIDATAKGNCSRFINHSCDPNCETQKWTVNGVLRIAFFTKKPVSANDELTFDYQFQNYGKTAQVCLCGSANCRGTLGDTKSTPIKSRKRPASMDKKKKDNFELDMWFSDMEELSHLEGLRNKDHVLHLCRLMVRGETNEQRLQIMKLLKDTTERACLRLFLEYHGLPLLWSWMADLGEGNFEVKSQILATLKLLPIKDRTILVESKILSIVQKWAVELEHLEKEAEAVSEPVQSILVLHAHRDDRQVKKKVKFADETSSDSEMSESSNKITSTQCISESKIVPEVDSSKSEIEGMGDENVLQSPDVESHSEKQDSGRGEKEMKEGYWLKRGSAATEESSDILLGENVIENLSSGLQIDSTDNDSKSEVGTTTTEAVTTEAGPMDAVTTEAGPMDAVPTEAGPMDAVPTEAIPMDASAQDSEKSCDVSDTGNDKMETEAFLKDDDSESDTKADPATRDLYATGKLASELLESWSGLKELFKIPKKQMVEERKRTERELDTGHGNDRKRRRDDSPEKPYSKGRSRFDRRKDDKDIEDNARSRHRKTLLPTPPKLTKEKHRQLFEAQVKAQDELKQQEASVAEEVFYQQYPYPPFMGDPAQPYPVEGTQVTYAHDSGQPYADPFASEPQQTYMADPNQPFVGHNVEAPGYQTQYMGDQQIAAQQQYIVDPNYAAYYQQQDPNYGLQAGTSAPPQVVLPPTVTQTAVTDQFGQPVAAVTDQFGQPVVTMTDQYGQPVPPLTTPFPPPQSYVAPVAPAVSVQPVAQYTQESQPAYFTTPDGVILPVTYAQSSAPSVVVPLQTAITTIAPQVAAPQTSVGLTEQSLAVLQQQQLLLQQQLAALAPSEDDPPPPPSPPKQKAPKLPLNWKSAVDSEGKTYYYHSITRQTQWDPPTWDTDSHTSSQEDIMDLGTPLFEDTSSKKKKTTTAAADTSTEIAKRTKEQFRNKMSSYIVVCLNPFRKPECDLGRITTTDDFKHLARRLTHHVMAKELKHCRHVEDLEVNENVKSKARDYIKKYMGRFGPVYKKALDLGPD